jgi:SAM-dependent methyltransferase
MAQEATRLGKAVTIIGLDRNSTMIEKAKKLYEQQNDHLSSKVTIELKCGDILQMEFNDATFDLVHSDITLLHVDMAKALMKIRRVLKINGRLIALEAGAGDMHSSDEVIINIYDSVLPSHRDRGAAIRSHFMLPKLHFRIQSSQPMALIPTGDELARGDKEWAKLKGAGEILVTKGMITEGQSQDFQKRYIEACQTKQILYSVFTFIIEAMKYE